MSVHAMETLIMALEAQERALARQRWASKGRTREVNDDKVKFYLMAGSQCSARNFMSYLKSPVLNW